MPRKTASITNYADYLRLDELLALQQPLSDSPDELHFITIHQIHELWFKVAILHLNRTREAVDGDLPVEALRLIGQVTEIFENLRLTARHLQSMPPVSFHVFRHLLAPASGMQSFQFREVELIAGRRDETYLQWVQRTFPRDGDWETVKRHLETPSLAQSLEALLTRCGVPDVATLLEHPEKWPELYALADGLAVFDHTVSLWRQTHIHLVERTIGAGTVGTGGTTHDFLQRASQVRFFPALWEARNELSRRMDDAE